MNKEGLKNKLSDEQYEVTQNSGTEAPFCNAFWNNHEEGEYQCVVCDVLLFKSGDKFDSGSGWPSFDKAIGDSVSIKTDISHGMVRKEVVCSNCEAHLGHVFNDGPKDTTGLRYCINSASMVFNKK